MIVTSPIYITLFIILIFLDLGVILELLILIGVAIPSLLIYLKWVPITKKEK